MLRHTRRDVAIPEERKDPVYPIEVIHGFTVFCRSSALSTRSYQALSDFGLIGKGRNDTRPVETGQLV